MMRFDLGPKWNALFGRRALLRSLLVCALFAGVVTSTAQVTGWKVQLSEANALRSQWTATAWRRALQKYQLALTNIRRASLRREEARVLRSIGLVHLALGDNTLALQNLNASLSLLKQLNVADTETADTLNDLANIHLLLGHNEEARTSCKESLNLSRKLAYLKGEGLAIELEGQVEYASGNLAGSLDLYDKALAVLKLTNDDTTLAQAFLDIGYSYSDLNETEKARPVFEQALGLWRSAKNPRGEALTLTALGHLHSKLGEKQQALDLYDQSIQLLEPLEDRIAIAFNVGGLGYIHAGLGDPSALEDYARMLELCSQANYRYGEAGALWKIAELHITNEDYKSALDYLNKSSAIAQSLGDPRMQAIPIALTGQVHERQNNPELALKSYNQALALNRQGKDSREEAYTLNSIGRMQEALGNRDKAFDTYTQALALNRAAGDRFGESGTLYRIAKLHQSFGKLKDAKAQSEQAIALVESLRAGVASHDLRSSYVATVHQLYELYVDILMSLHAAQPSAGFDGAALEASEAGRARTLLETLAEAKTQIREGVDPKLLERERALQLQLESLATRQISSSSAATAGKVETEIARVTAEYRDVQGQIRARSPHYAALVQPETLKLKQIQDLLEPGTLLLEYSLGEKRSFLWAITTDSLQSFELPSQTNIETLAQKLYAAITSISNTYDNDARSMSSMLFGRLKDLSKVKRLVIVADGALQYIPFAALPDPREADKLVSRYEIVRLPSASVLAVQRAQFANRTPAPKSVAVLADPVFDNLDSRLSATAIVRNSPASYSRSLRDTGLIVNGRIPRLQFASMEADAVYGAASPNDSLKAVGFKASRATAMDPALSQYKIIHIAAHGVLNSKHPELSAILLSMIDERGRPVDGLLQLHEIYNLKLPAELVVLSACETGVGKQIRGEGLIALTRGFMYAGAVRVVASLWKVDDAATAALMAQFYKEMFANGKRPAEALKEAQISISKQKRWRDPYYWAGFMLQGEWR
jgi:CHAT domain-containing protein